MGICEIKNKKESNLKYNRDLNEKQLTIEKEVHLKIWQIIFHLII